MKKRVVHAAPKMQLTILRKNGIIFQVANANTRKKKRVTAAWETGGIDWRENSCVAVKTTFPKMTRIETLGWNIAVDDWDGKKSNELCFLFFLSVCKKEEGGNGCLLLTTKWTEVQMQKEKWCWKLPQKNEQPQAWCWIDFEQWSLQVLWDFFFFLNCQLIKNTKKKKKRKKDKWQVTNQKIQCQELGKRGREEEQKTTWEAKGFFHVACIHLFEEMSIQRSSTMKPRSRCPW